MQKFAEVGLTAYPPSKRAWPAFANTDELIFTFTVSSPHIVLRSPSHVRLCQGRCSTSRPIWAASSRSR